MPYDTSTIISTSMKAEKIIFSFVAVLFGLLVAFGAFYFYQSTRAISPNKIRTISVANPTPTPPSSVYLTVSSPADEAVVNSKTLTISGKVSPNAIVAILTPTDQQIVTPTKDGSYSVTTTISDDENIIEITAIGPNGDEQKIVRTVTFSTEEF